MDNIPRMSTLEEIQSSINEVMIDKLKHVFNHFDFNNDKVWSAADSHILFSKVREAAQHLDVVKRNKIKDVMVKFLQKIGEREGLKALSWDLYLEGAIDRTVNHLEQYKREIQEFRNAIFDCMDADNDGYVTFDEYHEFRSIEGCVNEDRNKLVFNIMDRNKSGRISREEYLSAFVTYHLDPTFGYDSLPLYG